MPLYLTPVVLNLWVITLKRVIRHFKTGSVNFQKNDDSFHSKSYRVGILTPKVSSCFTTFYDAIV